MGWRFRKSFKLLPGVKINVSSRGVSTTIGGTALSLNVGPRGTFANVGIPGIGLSYRERLSLDAGDPSPASDGEREPSYPAPVSDERQVIESASTYELASEALAQLQRLLVDAGAEQRALDAEIAPAWTDANAKISRYRRWYDGFLFKHLMPSKFQQLGIDAHESAAKLAELQEQRRLAALATTIELAPEQRAPFGRLCDAFSALCACDSVWDTLAIQRANQFRERTIAVHTIERSPVKFHLGGSQLLACEWKIPHLTNANGGDLFLYPGFVLYQVSAQSFALIDIREVQLRIRPSRFIEEERLPSDAVVVGQTWKKANKTAVPTGDSRTTIRFRSRNTPRSPLPRSRA